LIDLLLESAVFSLSALASSPWMSQSAEHRLAFREFGLSIGLHSVERIALLHTQHPLPLSDPKRMDALLRALARHHHLSHQIEKFWLDPEHQANESWRTHRDINEVMLATSLVTGGYSSVSGAKSLTTPSTKE
jgi:hypothetical protein